jgi:hypothetical protein
MEAMTAKDLLSAEAEFRTLSAAEHELGSLPERSSAMQPAVLTELVIARKLRHV